MSVAGLLQLARSGIVEPTATTDMAELVSDALYEAFSITEERDVTMRETVTDGAAIRCDPALIERMLRNLIDNAALHNEPGGWIEIDSQAHGDQVITRITSTGRVLDEETVARLGEPFYRARAGERDVPRARSLDGHVPRAKLEAVIPGTEAPPSRSRHRHDDHRCPVALHVPRRSTLRWLDPARCLRVLHVRKQQVLGSNPSVGSTPRA
jgi:hypothetical protein